VGRALHRSSVGGSSVLLQIECEEEVKCPECGYWVDRLFRPVDSEEAPVCAICIVEKLVSKREQRRCGNEKRRSSES